MGGALGVCGYPAYENHWVPSKWRLCLKKKKVDSDWSQSYGCHMHTCAHATPHICVHICSGCLNKNGPYRLICLTIYFLVDGTDWEILGYMALLEKVCHWRRFWGFRSKPVLFPVSFLCFFLVDQDISSQLLLSTMPACLLPCFPPSETVKSLRNSAVSTLIVVSCHSNRKVTKTLGDAHKMVMLLTTDLSSMPIRQQLLHVWLGQSLKIDLWILSNWVKAEVEELKDSTNTFFFSRGSVGHNALLKTGRRNEIFVSNLTERTWWEGGSKN